MRTKTGVSNTTSALQKKNIRSKAFVLCNMYSTCPGVLVAVRLEALHSCFDHIDGRVAKDTGCARDRAAGQRLEHIELLVRIRALEPHRDRVVNQKADRLIAALSHQRGRKAAVQSLVPCFSTLLFPVGRRKKDPTTATHTQRRTFIARDRGHAVKEAAVLWDCLRLVVDKPDLDRLHGANDKDGLGDACAQSAHQGLERTQARLLGPLQRLRFEELERRKADGRLWDGKVQQRRQPAVQSKDAVIANRERGAVEDAAVFRGGRALVELELCLDILCGIGDANLNAARYAALMMSKGCENA
jgi:hypothetical protein